MFDITQEELEVAPIIPVSKFNCTVVSIMPFGLKETKPQIIPGYFQIPPAKDGEIKTLPVGESFFWMESPFEKMPPMKVTETSRAMARSIVQDFIEGALAVEADTYPGLFWVEGHYDAAGIEKDHKDKLKEVRKCQERWFVNLIRIADDDWQSTGQHKVISDIQRHAARAMGMKREWLDITVEAKMIQCPLCMELVRPDAIIHNSCGYILDVKKYEAMSSRVISKDRVSQMFGVTK